MGKDMKIIYKAITELKPYAGNPRHNTEAVKAVANSIQEFGFRNPIIIDKDNVIIAGHTRLRAAERLQLETVPTIMAEDLSDEQIQAYRLADNKTSELSDWDFEKLDKELRQLTSIDMTQFGFEELEASLDDVEEDAFDEEPPKEAKSRLGEIYQLGRHRLMCGDSTNNDIAQLMNGKKADLLVTDPPYNVGIVGRTEEALTIDNDRQSDDEFYKFLLKAFNSAAKHMHEGASYYIWHAHATAHIFKAALNEAGLPDRQQLIWVKNTFVMGRQDYQWSHEPCYYGWKSGGAHYFTSTRNLTTVHEDAPVLNKLGKAELVDYVKELQQRLSERTTILRENKPSASREHPTMKPIRLMASHISNSSKPTDIVLDLFGGSGSTLIAAEQLDRACYIMELDPIYVDVIINRWETFTGQKAILLTE